MGLDAYAVKLKNNSNWKVSDWEEIIEFDIEDFLSEDNFFKKYTINNQISRFINDEVLKNKDIRFEGDPCCSYELVKVTKESLNEWIDNNPDKDYIDDKTFKDNIEILDRKRIKELLEYLTLAMEHNCVFWFSY